MTFSDTVSQHREKQEQSLRRFVTYSLASSLVMHGIGLGVRVSPLKPEQSTSEEIVIVVTEDTLPEAMPEIEQPVEDFAEPNATTIVEAPLPDVFAPIAEEEFMPEDEPEPEPLPVPLAEEELSEEPIEEPIERTSDELTEESTTETEVAETTPETQNFSNLLEELRRTREQARQNSSERNVESRPTEPVRSSQSESNSTTVTAPRSPSSLPSPGPGAGEAENNEQGNRSREITCQGCNFDYPEQARGAEGTAQVIVETNDEGRVVSVTLSRSSGNPELDRAALEQARQRVRLEGAGTGESYPIDIDFVQPGSEAAERVRERGDRRSITVSDPEPELPETNETAESEIPDTVESPESDPPTGVTPSPEVTSSPEADPSTIPQPTLTPDSAPSPSPDLPTADTEPFDQPREAEPSPEFDLPAEVPASPEPLNWSPPSPEYTPEYTPSPEFLPELNFEPVPASSPEPEPTLNLEQ